MEWKTYDWRNQKVGQKGKVLTKVTYKCGFCKGQGLMSSKRSRCSVCLGNGIVKVAAPAVICAYCNGEGRSYLNRELTCIVCKGKGIVSVSSKDIEICSACKGRGKKTGAGLPCMECKGKGVIAKI